jgi:DNA-directed RNA polymerase subunit RPC12/RpoP
LGPVAPLWCPGIALDPRHSIKIPNTKVPTPANLLGMGNVKNQGSYKCPSCSGKTYYSSRETSGAYAITLNTPGPVDPTIVNTLKTTVIRCKSCQSEMKWIPTAAARKAMEKSDQKYYAFTGLFTGVLGLLCYVAVIGYAASTGLTSFLFESGEFWLFTAFCIPFSLLMIRTGIKNRRKLKNDPGKKS